ncbi:MAG: NAD(P)/FAD-dependent oxidoreductase [Euryarchaeota archaeon]|nr:NAD(P)/FAD-dependent oxidoreductase [Euryarchaeota archaeon]
MDAKVGIIGAGPAGVAAAVQLKRFDISSTIFEKDRIGGLIRNAHRVDNTMLFPNGISGKNFAALLEEYVKKYRISVVHREVQSARVRDSIILTTDIGEFEFEYLVVATGTRPNRLPYPGVHYHITELDSQYDSIMIIGGGDIALDYALSAAQIASEVIVLHRSELKALPALQEEVGNERKIRLLRGAVLDIAENVVRTTCGAFKVDKIIGAIGRVPNVEIVERITHPNVFLAGDVKNGIYRQSSLAIADGIRAAMDIWRRERYGAPAGNR